MKNSIALAVIGSRNCDDKELVWKELNKYRKKHDISCVVSGHAIGPDRFAEEWAVKNGIPTKIHYPDWNKHGKSAGFIRNAFIIEDCDVVFAFWDGKSAGTRHSLSLAKKLKKERIIIHYNRTTLL